MTKIKLSSSLKKYCDGKSEFEFSGSNVMELIQNLEAKYPQLADRLVGKNAQAKRFVRIYLDSEDLGNLDLRQVPVKPHQVLNVLLALAGG